VKVLVVKTSSMGDVVHALPAVSDLVANVPGVQVDWLVEKPFAAIPALHPAVRRVLPLAWRKWRKQLLDRETWQAMGELRRALREEPYDAVLDLQGLFKSALWGLQAAGPLWGYDRSSAREPWVAMLYDRSAEVPRNLQAVERNRRLAAAHFAYAMPSTRPDFGIRAPVSSWPVPPAYAVLMPNASRDEKLWPEAHWIAVGQRLQQHGWTPVVLWGGDAEQQRAQRIAAGCGAVVPPFLSVQDAAGVLGHARCIVGLDTGFTHLGAAFGRPTVGIYCDHDPGLAGITGPGPVASIGGKGVVPSLDDVLRLVEGMLS
jgi:heptosyltransferase I